MSSENAAYQGRRVFLLIFFALGSLIGGAIFMIYSGAFREYREEVSFEEKFDLQTQSQLISRQFDDIVTDLIFLSRAPSLTSGLATGDFAEARETFLFFAESKKRYAQIRFLDFSGLEKVRVDTLSGISDVIEEDNLQDKSDRYYFREAVQLGVGSIYVSPLDLNIERGKVEVPLNPMVRFAAPVYIGSEVRGVLVLNFSASEMLGELKSLGSRNTGAFYLLNEDGYFLASPHSGEEWGFMFPEGSEWRFDLMYPEAWEVLSFDETNLLKEEGGLLSTRVIRPLSGLDVGGEDYKWLAVDIVSREELRAGISSLRGRLFFLGGFLFLFSAIPAWLISQILARRAKQRQQLYVAAKYDELTGLPNRQQGQDRLNELLSTRRRYGSHAAVFFLDLDGFKKVNDNHGHEIGDHLLREVGERLSGNIRTSDMAVRYGGDEFLVLTPFGDKPGDLQIIAEKLIVCISELYLLPGCRVTIGVSIGIREIDGDEKETSEGLIKDADSAMYEAKQSGRGRYSVFKAPLET